MPTATLSSKGQVTVPVVIREQLGIREGDKLEFTIDEQGRIIVRPQGKGMSISGILSEFAPEEALSVQEMDAAIHRRAAEKASTK